MIIILYTNFVLCVLLHFCTVYKLYVTLHPKSFDVNRQISLSLTFQRKHVLTSEQYNTISKTLPDEVERMINI